jgi:hypothetical protein
VSSKSMIGEWSNRLSDVFARLVDTRGNRLFLCQRKSELSDLRRRAGWMRVVVLSAKFWKTAGAASLFLMRGGGGPASDVETCVFENCLVNVVARCYAILFPRTDPSNRVAMSSRHPLKAYDPRTGRLLVSADQLAVELGPVEPGSARLVVKSRSLDRPSSARAVRVSAATRNS